MADLFFGIEERATPRKPRSDKPRRVKELVARRPFTDTELRLVAALGNCSFLPGSAHKRFVRDMNSVVKHKRDIGITEKQSVYLQKIAWRYRKQMPEELVILGVTLDWSAAM